MTRDQLIEAHRGLVPALARKFRDQDHDELCGEGYLALCRAAEAFDPSRGAKFSTYAYHKVWGAISHWVRYHRPGGRFGRDPVLLSLDAEAVDGARFEELLVDEGPDPCQLVLEFEDSETLKRQIAWLPKDERGAVRAFLGERLIREFGEASGMSENWARGRFNRAVQRLRYWQGASFEYPRLTSDAPKQLRVEDGMARVGYPLNQRVPPGGIPKVAAACGLGSNQVRAMLVHLRRKRQQAPPRHLRRLIGELNRLGVDFTQQLDCKALAVRVGMEPKNIHHAATVVRAEQGIPEPTPLAPLRRTVLAAAERLGLDVTTGKIPSVRIAREAGLSRVQVRNSVRLLRKNAGQ